MKLGTV